MPEPADDFVANLAAVRRAAEHDPDDAGIAADDAGTSALAQEIEPEAPAKP